MDRKPNHLLGQTSPYLIQHLYNPVDWRPWGADALNEARDRDLPIFLSIGYAACHWCHVMERESFEDEQVAEFMNNHFVPVKVDREERPDLDEIYMNAVQVMTRQGGWPLNVFLMPDQRPFFGGTYFPPLSGYGRPGFLDLLVRVHDTWEKRREQVEEAAGGLTEQLRAISAGIHAGDLESPPLDEAATTAADRIAATFDPVNGGFSHAPKFPPDTQLAFLFRQYRRTGQDILWEMVDRTLTRMALGGMYDQVGGGFARYSVDERWLVPHFEKMLYNQALLVPVYCDAWHVDHRPLFRRTVCDTLDFVRREMIHDEGGAFSSLDADSEGEEGKFYVFKPEQVVEILGKEDGALFNTTYGITTGGNFEGDSIPNLLHGEPDEAIQDRLAGLKSKLLAARETRIRPGTDDKILTAWNGLMITGFTAGYQAFGRQEDLDSARRCADFILANLLQEGRLLASWREGHAAHPAYLDDYAFLARGLLDLYEAGGGESYLNSAGELGQVLLDHFEDKERGGWYFTADDHEDLLVRNRSGLDGALPSGAGVATEILVLLAARLNIDRYREAAVRALSSYAGELHRAPNGCSSLLAALDYLETGVPERRVCRDGVCWVDRKP